ncbi:hypothetical protein Glove_393g38 [Diversispora epigaea]|nr:hypothetical protein Glove_393g38 [Diversispora epigaea]
MIGDKRTRLDINKLENTLKIRSYYLISVKNELSHYVKKISESELRKITNNSAIGNNEQIISQTTLILENIVYLTQPIFENNENNSDTESVSETDNIERNMNFDSTTLVNEIFEN